MQSQRNVFMNWFFCILLRQEVPDFNNVTEVTEGSP